MQIPVFSRKLGSFLGAPAIRIIAYWDLLIVETSLLALQGLLEKKPGKRGASRIHEADSMSRVLVLTLLLQGEGPHAVQVLGRRSRRCLGPAGSSELERIEGPGFIELAREI